MHPDLSAGTQIAIVPCGTKKASRSLRRNAAGVCPKNIIAGECGIRSCWDPGFAAEFRVQAPESRLRRHRAKESSHRQSGVYPSPIAVFSAIHPDSETERPWR